MTTTRSLTISATPAANAVTMHFENESTLQSSPFHYYGGFRAICLHYLIVLGFDVCVGSDAVM
jgi:hypothetical protein